MEAMAPTYDKKCNWDISRAPFPVLMAAKATSICSCRSAAFLGVSCGEGGSEPDGEGGSEPDSSLFSSEEPDGAAKVLPSFPCSVDADACESFRLFRTSYGISDVSPLSKMEP